MKKMKVYELMKYIARGTKITFIENGEMKEIFFDEAREKTIYSITGIDDYEMKIIVNP